MIREQGKNLEKYMRNLDEELQYEKLYDEVCQEFDYLEGFLDGDILQETITDIVHFTVCKVRRIKEESNE